MVTEKNYTFGTLQITQIIREDSQGITKDSHVLKLSECGNYWETLSPLHPDYKKAIILMHNKKISEQINEQ